MNDSQVQRPVTSKPRGFCKYYTTPRGCFSGNSCKFLHVPESSVAASESGQPPVLTPYDKSKRCKFYAKGYCKREGSCWFLHIKDSGDCKAKTEDEEEDQHCSICFEKPLTYGLLTGCSHIFCLQCLRQWRDPARRNRDIVELDNTKKCPMCRTSSRYIAPSSVFYKEGQEEKKVAIEKYKESMSKVPCKHFETSKAKNPNKPLCPFGKDCFYRHTNADGTPHIFKEGVDASMRAFHRRRGRPSTFDFFLGESLGRGGFDINGSGLAGNIAVDMFDRMVTEVMRGASTRTATGSDRQQGGERTGNGTNMDRARDQMMAAAMTAIRSELSRLERSRPNPTTQENTAGGAGAQDASDPVDTPLLTPTEAPGEAVEGWNEFLSEAGIGDDTDVVERLEMLTDHMLGSLIVFGQQQQQEQQRPSSPPVQTPSTEPALFRPIAPLDAIRGITMPTRPPLRDEDDDDDIPELESVSDSSSENLAFSDSSDDESDSEMLERVSTAVRNLDLAFTVRASSGNDPEPGLSPPPLRRVESSSPRFSTVVGRNDMTPADASVPDLAGTSDQPSQSGAEDVTPPTEEPPPLDVVTAHEPPFVHSVEPPFVTDGRGRVVWTNKSSDTPDVPPPVPAHPSGDASDASIATTEDEPTDGTQSTQRSLLGRMLNALF